MNKIREFYRQAKTSILKNQELGGYVHDTSMSLFIPPNAMHITPMTNITYVAGTVTGTVCAKKAAAAETIVINVPVMAPTNSVALKGSYIKSIEFDYQIGVILTTSVTVTMNKVTRGADTVGLTVASVPCTQDLAAAVAAATMAKHKLVATVTTPIWLLNTEYLLVTFTFVAVATTTLDMLGAVVNYTFRV
jgi:hypothetical protein